MPSYFIEMGQGIIANSNDLRIATSALLTCTFIAGFNEQVGYAGAFHYLAGYLLKVSHPYEYPEDARPAADSAKSASLVRRPIHNEEFLRKNKVVSDMVDWVRTLRPTRVVLVYGSLAHNTEDILGKPIVEKDFNKVHRWIQGHCPSATVRAKMEANAAMIIEGGKMYVGSAKDLETKHPVNLSEGQINLQNMLAGRYPE